MICIILVTRICCDHVLATNFCQYSNPKLHFTSHKDHGLRFLKNVEEKLVTTVLKLVMDEDSEPVANKLEAADLDDPNSTHEILPTWKDVATFKKRYPQD